MSEIAALEKLYRESEESLKQDFFSFLRFKSVSAQPEHRADVIACADWVQQYLSDSGLQVERVETSGYPLIIGLSKEPDPSKPTVLIYNHYDVQPPEPLEKWKSDPFEPLERDGQVYARGAQDNKGQCFYVMAAVRKLLERDGSLPVNIGLLIEGEEEIGSPGMAGVLPSIKEKIKADHLLIADLGLKSLEQPAVTLGVRGIMTFTLKVSGAAADLHSGTHGGIVKNPNQVIAQLLSSLHDASGKVKVPGFYDNVRELTEEERATIHFDLDEAGYAQMFGASLTGGEEGYSATERAWIRPTLEINGIGGGYAGEGFKTVIPAEAVAKISCRLVPDQSPEGIANKVKGYLESQATNGVRVSVNVHPGGGKAVRTAGTTRVAQCVASAYSEIYGKPCEYSLEGGSIPIVTELAEACGGETVLMGYGLPSDNIHAPNEHFGLDRLRLGFLTIARSLQLLAHAK